MTERRRTFAVIRALGDRPRQAAAFVVGAALLVVVLGGGLAAVLASVPFGPFDPPRSSLAVPWGYLVLHAALVVGSIVVASAVLLGENRRAAVTALRKG